MHLFSPSLKTMIPKIQRTTQVFTFVKFHLMRLLKEQRDSFNYIFSVNFPVESQSFGTVIFDCYIFFYTPVDVSFL